VQSPFAHAARRPRDSDGAVAVEFALIMPILFMIVFGIIEFGYMLNRDMIVGNASRDGARVASLNGTYAEICSSVKNELSASGIPVPAQCNTAVSSTNPTEIKIDCRKVDDTACNATSTTYDTLAEPGATAIIQVTYDHSLITPGLAFLGDSVGLEQSTQMRVE
jgi:Flp pilus assembly protein TadG